MTLSAAQAPAVEDVPVAIVLHLILLGEPSPGASAAAGGDIREAPGLC
jgi:hypothetical protein